MTNDQIPMTNFPPLFLFLKMRPLLFSALVIGHWDLVIS